MITTVIVIVLALCALGTLVLAVFMLMDGRKENDDGFASRVTKAVDTTAKANGLWTKRLRINAIVFLILLLGTALCGVYIMQNYHGSSWNW